MKIIQTTTLCMLFLALPVFSSNASNHKTNTAKNTIVKDTKLKQEQLIVDREIVGIVIAVDKNEIAAAKEIHKKKVDVLVQNYAKYLQKQHTDNLDQILNLASVAGLKPVPSKISKSLAKQGKQELNTLKTLNNKPLASAYIDAMIKGHTAGLQLINSNLLKHATNTKLHQFLISFRSLVSHHLAKAIKIKKQLNDSEMTVD